MKRNVRPIFVSMLFFVSIVQSSSAQILHSKDTITLQPEDSITRIAYDTIMIKHHSNLNLVTPETIGSSVGSSDWNFVGLVYDESNYALNYYKLLQINANNDRYESIIEVSVQGDANFYQNQGTYRIRVDKYEGTSARFDGLEIQCISGNPKAANFYVYNNALWIRSNYNWGEISYRTVADFPYYSSSASPLAGPPFSKTTSAPTGYLTSTGSYGLKCDFDHNAFYLLPYTDVNGSMFIYQNLNVKGSFLSDISSFKSPTNNREIDINPGGLTIDFKPVNGEAATINRTVPTSLNLCAGGGNLMVGYPAFSTTSYKLDVNGNIRANKVVVNTTGADYVFDSTYHLTPLDSLHNYIKKYHHLPGIPSAEQMRKEGLDVGKTQTRLLQKIEELTLYIIEQDKVIRNRNKKIFEERTKISHLEEQLKNQHILLEKLQQGIIKNNNDHFEEFKIENK